MLATTVCLATVAPSAAQRPDVSAGADRPPADLAPAIASALNPRGTLVRIGGLQLQLWWVKALGLEGAGNGRSPWSQVPEGSLVGVVQASGAWSGIRGYSLRPGTYTLRFGLQPQNGDHMGISPYREFLLVAPAAADLTPAPVGHDDAVELAGKASRRSHPAVLSIDPPKTSAPPLTVTSNELGHDVVIFAVPTAGGTGEGPGLFTFGLVVRGTIEQ